MIDAALVKERISLVELFTRDGHELRRAGSSYVCKSPFSQEKTPSCHVHEEERFFKCFSSGAGGDCFIYWQTTRGVGFAEAVLALAQIAGLTEGYVPALLPSKPAPKPIVELAPRLDGKHLETWLRAVEHLRLDYAAQEKIATARGFAPETIAWAVERGLMGSMPFLGAWREAFVVERPDGDGQIPVGFHLRLAPNSPANETPKASWRFVPKGQGSWPFVIGNVRTAKVIFCMEGQWDALALVDAAGWADPALEKWPENIAIVAMRGATSWERFVRFYTWPAEATCFTFADRDAAGSDWFKKDGFVEILYSRCKRVLAFWPFVAGAKDFNDVWKARAISREELLLDLRSKMKRAVKVPDRGPTFLQFCRQQKWRPDAIGISARLICENKKCPKGRQPIKVWERFWQKFIPEDCHPGMVAIWSEWKAVT